MFALLGRRSISFQPFNGIVSRNFLVGRQLMRMSSIEVPSTNTGMPSAASKPQQITEEEAKGKAQQILQWFPGETLPRKATYATLTGGLTAFLVANGIYIPNDETLIVIAFILVVRTLYVKLSTPIANMIDASINELRTKLSASRVAEIDTVKLEISELEQLRDLSSITTDLFETKRDNVVLEAELNELVERNKFLAAAKVRLDEAVRKATEKKLAERRALVDSIMTGVMNELKEGKLQDRILKQCLVDLERIPKQSSL